MPRASQDYSDQDYQRIKRAATLKDTDIRHWIAAAAVAAAEKELREDAQKMLDTLNTPQQPTSEK